VPFTTLRIGRCVFVRWQNPLGPDLDRLALELATQRSTVKEPLQIVSLVPSTSEPPDESFRKGLLSRWDAILRPGEKVVSAIPGASIKASLNRATATTLRTFLKRPTIGRVYQSVDEALRACGLGDDGIPPMIEQLTKAGMLAD
jgi:hypothetical protein